MSKPKRRKPISEINIVPYIDVMLVLLVIFMVATPLMNQGIKVDLPKAGGDSLDLSQDDLLLIVTIKADSTYYMNTGDEDEPVELAKIKDTATKIIAANPAIKVLVEGDQSLSYGVIIQLMDILQKAGASNVGLITEPSTT